MTRLLRILILFLFCLQASQVSYATANDDSLAAITEKLSWIHDQLLEHGTFTFQKTVNKNGEGIEVLDIQNKITVFDYDQTVISYKRLRNESSNPKGAVEITYKFHLEHIEKVEVKAYQLEGVEEKLWQVVLLTKDKHKLVLLNGYLNVSLVPFTVDNEAAALSIQQAFEEVLTMVHAL